MATFINEESIQHLYKKVQDEVTPKNYLSYFEDVFSNYVYITEKIDGMSFSAKYDYDEDELKFYKRNKDKQISYFDKLLMRQYDFFIDYFEERKEFIKEWFETNFDKVNEVRIDVEIIVDNDLALIKYDVPPKNKMMLTGVQLNGKTLIDKESVDKLLHFCDEFEIEMCPIIFIGNLSKTKIEKLSKSVLKLIDNRDMFNFVDDIIKVLNPKRVIKKDEYFEGVVVHVEGMIDPLKIIDVDYEGYKKIQNDVMPDFKTEYPKAQELVTKYFNYVVNNKDMFDRQKELKELTTKDKKSVLFNSVMFYYFAMAHEEEIKDIEEEEGNDIFRLKNIGGIIPEDVYNYITENKKSEFLIRYILRLTKGSRIKIKEIDNDKYVKILKELL